MNDVVQTISFLVPASYLKKSRRPYSVQNIFDNLHGAFPKNDLQTVLETDEGVQSQVLRRELAGRGQCAYIYVGDVQRTYVSQEDMRNFVQEYGNETEKQTMAGADGTGEPWQRSFRRSSGFIFSNSRVTVVISEDLPTHKLKFKKAECPRVSELKFERSDE